MMPEITGTDGDDWIHTKPKVFDRVVSRKGNDRIYASTGGDSYEGDEGEDTIVVKADQYTSGITSHSDDRTIVVTRSAVQDINVPYPNNFTFDHSGIEIIVFLISGFTAPDKTTSIVVGADFTGRIAVSATTELGLRTNLGGSLANDSYYLFPGYHVVDGGPGNDEMIFERSNYTKIADYNGGFRIQSFSDETGFGGNPVYDSIVLNVEKVMISSSNTFSGDGYIYDASNASRSIEFIVREGSRFLGGSGDDIFFSPSAGGGILTRTLLAGGQGADLFQIQGLGGLQEDSEYIITDFESSDRLDFDFGGTGTKFVGTHTFTGGREVRYINEAGKVILQFDLRESDGVTDASITLNGNFALEQLPGTTLLRIKPGDFIGTGDADILQGSDGDDVLRGLAGNDVLLGKAGNDILHGGLGPDQLDGGPGLDAVNYEDVEGAVFVNLTLGRGYTNSAFDDTYTSIENVIGTAFNDFIIGDSGMNRLDGGAGDDTLIGAIGGDALLGGSGTDTASYEDNSGTVFVNLTLNAGSNNAAQGDSYSGIENLVGGLFDDFFIGDEQANRLDGAMGADTLLGAGGADTFVFKHAPGAASEFSYANSSANVETILDFQSGVDKIELSQSAFSALGLGQVNASAFVLGTAAQDADDRLIYDQATGQLYYDADGSGSGEAMRVATLDNKGPLAATDFVVA